MDQSEKFRPKISFLSKNTISCPVCGCNFYHENLMFGGGRLIADEITDMLHRTYKPSQKYDNIYPLVYPVMVCQDCYYATLPGDFDKAPRESLDMLKELRHERLELSNKLIGDIVDYSKYRTLESGAVSYVIAAMCYDHFPKKFAPVIKQAICFIRAAFLFEDLNKAKPHRYYNYLAEIFYKKALFFYKQAVFLSTKKEQIMENLKVYGPDIDKDYGFDGITYLIAILTYKFGDKTDPEARKKDLEEAKIYFGRLFGMGKSNVNKPKEILERSKDYYEVISSELKTS